MPEKFFRTDADNNDVIFQDFWKSVFCTGGNCMPPLKLQFSDSPAIQIFGYQTTMPYIDITTMR
ncbi:hypothetical protein ACUMT2_005382, partial [Escherichia coli]